MLFPLEGAGNPARTLLRILLVLSLGLLFSCGQEEQELEYVARVHDQYLTDQELDEALRSLPAQLDTADARKQIIEQWVTNALLFEEASRRGLRETEEVQRLMQESERSIMASALLTRLYEEESIEPSPADIQAYFERHRDLFRIREPFVRVRYLSNVNEGRVERAREEIAGLSRSDAPDSSWRSIARRYSADPAASIDLAGTHVPMSHLFPRQPDLHDVVGTLGPGQVSPIIEADSAFHVVQVAERAEPGSVPRVEWVEEELRRRLAIQSRKQIYARQVQRLRNEALAREELEIE